MHCQYFWPITTAMAAFYMNQFHQPTSLQAYGWPQQETTTLELHIDDASKELEATMKLFVKQGKSKARRQRPQQIQRTTSYILAEIFYRLKITCYEIA